MAQTSRELILQVDKMRKYRVFVRGENFLMNREGRKQKMGFYAARFVEAQDEEEAVCAAVEVLRCDPKLLDSVFNQESDSPLMYAEEIEELEVFDGHPVPGNGFTFYAEE